MKCGCGGFYELFGIHRPGCLTNFIDEEENETGEPNMMTEHKCPRCDELTDRYGEDSLCEDCQDRYDYEEDLHNSQSEDYRRFTDGI